MRHSVMGNGHAPSAAPEKPDSGVEERLDRLEQEVRDQGDRARNIQRGFAIFALVALLIAGVNLLVVASKLDKKSSTPAAAAAAPAATTATPAAAAGSVGVSLKEYTVSPSPAQAAAGKVTFNVRNDGQIKHEFVVVKTNKPAGSLLKGNEADETGNVGEIGGVNPGSAKKLTLNLKAGHYALICNLPGHYKAGQHADFTVR